MDAYSFLKDRIREIQAWHEIKENLKPEMKYDTINVDKHQLESYTKRWIQQAKIMGDSGSPGERQNLLGQLASGIDHIKKNKAFKDVEKQITPLLEPLWQELGQQEEH